MKTHPHRYAFISLLRKTPASAMQKFNYTNKESCWTITALFTSVITVILFFVSLLSMVYSGTGDDFTPNVKLIMLIPFIAQFLAFLLYPVPGGVIKSVIKDVHNAEDSDGLEKTPPFWIYFHYFILRNHPLLSGWAFIVRQMFIALIFYCASFYIVDFERFMLLVATVAWYISYTCVPLMLATKQKD